jgi:hypothetical protein
MPRNLGQLLSGRGNRECSIDANMSLLRVTVEFNVFTRIPGEVAFGPVPEDDQQRLG